MFEAHYISESDYPTDDFGTDTGLTRRLHSRVHHCPLHVWTARGKRKDEADIPHPHWFVYIEYCRTDGSHGYRLLEQPCSQGLAALISSIPTLELPAIDPQQTRAWLEAPAAVDTRQPACAAAG